MNIITRLMITELVLYYDEGDFMNSFQQPITSEPSLGTPHPRIVSLYSTNPADATAIEIDCSPYVPKGSKQITLTSWYRRLSGNMVITFHPTNSAVTFATADDFILDYASTNYLSRKLTVRLDDDGKFYFNVVAGSCDSLGLFMKRYYM